MNVNEDFDRTPLLGGKDRLETPEDMDSTGVNSSEKQEGSQRINKESTSAKIASLFKNQSKEPQTPSQSVASHKVTIERPQKAPSSKIEKLIVKIREIFPNALKRLVQQIRQKFGTSKTVATEEYKINISEKQKNTAQRAVLTQNRFKKDSSKTPEEGDKLTDVLSIDDETLKEVFGETALEMTYGSARTAAFSTTGKGSQKDVKSQGKSERKLGDKLVQGIVRKEAKVQIGKTTYTQSACHSLGGQITRGTTTSSEANKKAEYNRKTENHCSNLNVVTNDKGEFVSSRCGRMDSAGRVLEVVDVSLDASLRSTKEGKLGKGLYEDKEGNLHYQMSITSGQDVGWAKNLLMKAKAGFGLRKDHVQDIESQSIDNIKESIQEIWGDKESIDHKVIGADGTEQTVKVDRPIFKTAVLSGEGKRFAQGALKANQKANLADSERECVLLQNKLKAWEGDPKFQSDFAKKLCANLKEFASGRAHFNSKEHKNKIADIKNSISEVKNPEERNQLLKLYFSIQAVTINLTGKDLSGQDRCTRKNPLDAGRVAILDMYLHEFLNLAENDQCKSGCDRTLFLVSARLAMKSFEEEKGIPADPLDFVTYTSIQDGSSDHEQQLKFAEYFLSAAKELGPNVVSYVRGEPKVKWGGHEPIKMFGDFKKGSRHGTLQIV